MKLSTHYALLDTPIGALKLRSNGSCLTAIEFPNQHSSMAGEQRCSDAALTACAKQLTEYFAGDRNDFDLPIDAGGTSFQQMVWSALADIPYGELRSYKDIANAIGKPKAVRAVGAANGSNPLPIVVPCHRVIGSDGSLTGFTGGLAMKTQLLTLEGALLI